jgi:hypothetical protein
MVRAIPWEQQIGRRLRLRDLFVFFTVVEYGSMGRAGAKLGVSTPSISEAIATLEHALGVRLLDRSPKGVVATLMAKPCWRAAGLPSTSCGRASGTSSTLPIPAPAS